MLVFLLVFSLFSLSFQWSLLAWFHSSACNQGGNGRHPEASNKKCLSQYHRFYGQSAKVVLVSRVVTASSKRICTFEFCFYKLVFELLAFLHQPKSAVS
uniref:Putative secreted protein ovary overexpressed n=1 Tax=Rhipicephalus microplus TaxID=6941 RepID=A0A6M2DB30_RHIMP